MIFIYLSLKGRKRTREMPSDALYNLPLYLLYYIRRVHTLEILIRILYK